MTQMLKRSLAWLMVLLMCMSLVSVFGMSVHAADTTVDYKKDGNYIYNWGEREETSTFLSPMALDFYKKYSITYDKLTGFAGGSTQSNAHTSALYKELQRVMKQAHSHETDYGETRPLYKYTDCENNGNVISSFYSGVSVGPAWDSGATWNREHTWPNSKGLAGNDENDIMMLRPTASSENFSRGNKAYGKSSGYYFPNSESYGAHDVRGDVARIFLYVYVRWGNTTYAWGTSGVMESVDVLLEWMEADPVDTWEMGRNDSVQSITGTRNVFVDYPELAFLLFGEEIPSDMPSPSGDASGSTSCNHIYDNSCDANCNLCGAVRVVHHVYDGNCDTDCNACGSKREAGNHSYKFYCSESCSVCGTEREAKHIYSGWQVVEPATESAPGLEVGTCIYCKGTGEREIPQLTPPADDEPINPPASSNPSVTPEDDKCEHTFGEWQDSENGKQIRTCTKCGDTETKSVDNNEGGEGSSLEEESAGFFAAIAEFFKMIFEWIASLFE